MKKYILLLLVSTIAILNANYIEIEENRGEPIVGYYGASVSEIEINFNLSGYDITLVDKGEITYSHITIPNEGNLLQPGKPDLPTVTRLFAVPDAGEVEFKINWTNESILETATIFPSQPLKTESSREELPFTQDEGFYRLSQQYPENIVQIGDPVILRDIRLVPVTFHPFQYNAAEKELKLNKNINITLSVSGRGGSNIKSSDRKRSRSFEKIYRSVITNFDQLEYRDLEYQIPSYLFIYPEDDQIENYLQELVNWKHQKGFEVTAVSTEVTGVGQAAILNYIQDAYDTWENPPEYLCLVGDAAGAYNIPTGHYVDPPYNGEGDHVYSTLEGDDILADLIIGRLSFNSTMEFLTILSKILNYERTPYLDDTDWFNNAVLVGDPTDSGQSCVDTKMYIKDMISEYNPEMDFHEIYSGNWVTEIASGLNTGASYFNYRGFVGMSGWTTGSINSLHNGYMMPFAVSLTCLTGDFEGLTDCISERFLKAGTPTAPKGAIAAISTATGNTHTCFNNLVDGSIYSAVFADEIYNPGGALVKGKLALYMTYPGNPFDHVLKFSYWNNLMGDPGLELWTGVPEEMVVNYSQEIAVGTNNLEISVTDLEGSPLENVWITVLQGNDDIFVSGHTDEMGQIILPVMAQTPGTASVTFTKHNFIPQILEMEIIEAVSFVNLASYVIDDDNNGSSIGNADGLWNPGETIELEVELMNFGSSSVTGIIAELQSSSDDITLISDVIELGQIPAGSTETGTFLLQLNENAIGGSELEFDLLISDDIGGNWTDLIYLSVYGPYLEIIAYQFEDGNDNILSPGETAELILNTANIGAVGLQGISAESL
ncbi:C25 family cysteine peptidase [Candidatus Cloacimonadota bacterium]